VNIQQHTYSFEVGHVGGIDWRSYEAQMVDLGFVRAVLIVLNEQLYPHIVSTAIILMKQAGLRLKNFIESHYFMPILLLSDCQIW